MAIEPLWDDEPSELISLRKRNGLAVLRLLKGI